MQANTLKSDIILVFKQDLLGFGVKRHNSTLADGPNGYFFRVRIRTGHILPPAITESPPVVRTLPRFGSVRQPRCFRKLVT